MVTKVIKRMEEIKAESGKEILLKVEIIQKKEKKSLTFFELDIKNEASSDDDSWKYEYLDEVLDKSPIVLDDCSVDGPISIKTKQENAEEHVKNIKVHTKMDEIAIKQESLEKSITIESEMFDTFSKNLKSPLENLKSRAKTFQKLYNNGNPRKTHLLPRINRTLLPGELYTCDKCGIKFLSWMSIYSHVTTVHKLVGDFKCENCSKIFKTPGNLKRHVQSIHKKIRSFVCHICAQAFPSNSKLMMHFHVHSEPEECKLCGRLVRNMKQHLKRHESSANRTFLTCPVCGKIYDKFVLPVHIDRVHVKSFNGNVFRCDKCDNEYTRREDLRQ